MSGQVTKGLTLAVHYIVKKLLESRHKVLSEASLQALNELVRVNIDVGTSYLMAQLTDCPVGTTKPALRT